MAAAQFFTVLIFIIINFAILFVVKSRTTTVTSLIIAHLVAALFFSISISGNEQFKEMVLSLIIYSMVILFLISNYDFSAMSSKTKIEIERRINRIIVYLVAVLAFIAVFAAVFSLTKNFTNLSNAVIEKKILLQGEVALNPMLLPSHPVHNTIKKFYLGRNFDAQKIDESVPQFEANERKIARLKDSLLDNFLLKRSSDMILIIVAISCVLLLLAQKKNEQKNESL